jgi:hypothetical protein
MSLVTEQQSMRSPRRYSIGTTSYARSATSDRVETRSLCSMVFIWSS